MWPLVEGAIAIAVAGAIGGLLNAIQADGGLRWPRHDTTADRQRIWLPGWLGNCVVGLFAAEVSWALYGPAATFPVIGSSAQVPPITITLAALGGAALVGVGGARWLSNEVDKKIQQGNQTSLARVQQAAPQAVINALRTERPVVAMSTVKKFVEQTQQAGH